MPTTLDRLRRLHNLREQRVSSEPKPDQGSPALARSQAAQPLDKAEPGLILENDAGPYYLVSRAYPLTSVRGTHSLAAIFKRRPSVFSSSYPKYSLEPRHHFQQAAFIDTETTGLGTGAGVYCFMIGVGTFEYSGSTSHSAANDQEPDQFVVRQFFMRNPAEEAAILMAVAELLANSDLSITFNGRSFDLPLLRARYRQNRTRLPVVVDDIPLLREHAPHLDLLHPSRRIWKRRLGSCRLLNLEQHILNVQRTEQDVPGHLIPLMYTEYLRTGNAVPMASVFYHNREDIVSMVGLTTTLTLAFDQGALSSDLDALHPVDYISVAETMEHTDAIEDAEAAYRHALRADLSLSQRAGIFSRLGRLLKRQERWREAVELWQLWLTSVPGSNPEPFIELAKYHEWHSRDMEQAEMWTAWAIHNIEADGSKRNAQWLPELRHRLQRIQGKRGADS